MVFSVYPYFKSFTTRGKSARQLLASTSTEIGRLGVVSLLGVRILMNQKARSPSAMSPDRELEQGETAYSPDLTLMSPKASDYPAPTIDLAYTTFAWMA